jgi:UDP-N-acetyl-D-mannosaminuronate dehydrogenase
MTDNANTITTVGIIGLGYVGLPLATAFAEAGLRVVGYDLAAVVEHADLVVDLRNAVRNRLGGSSGSIPPNVDVL